ncbi:hypothetical protein LCGC14_2608600 [marine sediment metagenome]|uniref:Uncharacterized protein n=1 Tax=marine sediment metagenome TaxID=412755 RepID=A0A0F9CZA9_9ZZZZ
MSVPKPGTKFYLLKWIVKYRYSSSKYEVREMPVVSSNRYDVVLGDVEFSEANKKKLELEKEDES